MNQSISQLDNHTISLIRSGVYLQSFNHALKALIQISIRSDPTSISTSIDPHSGYISVDDNGIGIDKRLVHLFGSFDSTSLVSPPNNSNQSEPAITSYLSRSQHRILDSLAHLSSLDICSRSSDSSHTHQTLLKDGQVFFSAPAKTSRRHNRGTTTTIRNLFYNLPVRKIMETDPNRLQTRLKRIWNESKIIIQSLAIIYPNITFTLRNSSVNHLAGFDHSSRLSDQTSYYAISKTGSSISTFGKIFGREFVQDSIPFGLTIDGLKVSGLFGKKRHASRSSQLIYLDRVLVNSSNLHKTVANLFARLQSRNASTLSVEQTLVSTQMTPSSRSVTSTADRYPVYLILFSNDCSLQQDQNRQRSDDHNKFFSDDKQEDLIPQIEEKLNKVLVKIFSQVFPAMRHNTPEIHQSSPCLPKRETKQTKILNPFSSKRTLDSRWPVTKRARLSNQSVSSEPKISLPPRDNHEDDCVQIEMNELEGPCSEQKLDNTPSSCGSKFEFLEGFKYDGAKKSRYQPIHLSDKNLGSIKPISTFKSGFQYKHLQSTRSSKLVGSRGQVLPPLINDLHVPNIHLHRLANLKPMPKDNQSPSSINRPSNGLLELVHRSPHFSNEKGLKPSVDLSKLKARFQYKMPTGASMKKPSNNPKDPIMNNLVDAPTPNESDGGSHLLNASMESYHQSNEFYKVDLSQLSNTSTFTVIGQLDLKFIIVKIHDKHDQQAARDGGLIVAFDQHAVHERIRIEKFLRDICTGNFKIKKLISSDKNFDCDPKAEMEVRCQENYHENSFPVLVNGKELEGLVTFRKQFERWGIIYEIHICQTPENVNQFVEDRGHEDEDEFKQIYMVAVPELLWDRVKSEGSELVRKILKGCLGFFEDRGWDSPLNIPTPANSQLAPANSCINNSEESNSRDWFKFIKDCPTILVDLLNSKACRGSIMFGDEISDSVSSKLIIKLSQTVLPFSCAHGRPTCFPLFHLDEAFSSHRQSKFLSHSGLKLKSDLFS